MKKFLSLVLALVMTMSLVTISAGAKDFTDADKVNYDEAISVLSAVKVIDGYTDGSFKPQTQLNRGQAAKILCNMILGPTTASALKADAAPFKDVAADNTFAGYIAYCVKAGIIDGYTDGTFKPTAPLTGYAFMKYLLGALGYDKDVEGYNGNNWSINVAKQALGIGLDDGLLEDFDGTKIVTREEACLYALNTLKATMVEYDAKTSVNVGDATVVIAGSKAQDVKQGTYKSFTGDAKDETLEFCEKYFKDLKLTPDSDDFGRPANTWKVKNTEIGTFANKADLVATFSKKVTKSKLYETVGKSVYDALTDKYDPSYLAVFFDGDCVAREYKGDKAVIEEYVEKNNSGKVNGTGNGDLTEVYVDSYSNVTIVTLRTYLFQVVNDYDSKKETVTLTANSEKFDTEITLADRTLDAEDFPAIKDFKADDYVLVTAAVNAAGKYEVKSVEKAETVTEEITGYKYDGDVTTATKTYDYSATADSIKETGYNVGHPATLILDKYGYVIGVDEAVVLSDYVYIDKFGTTSSLNSKAVANAVFTDGTSAEIVVKEAYDKVAGKQVKDKATIIGFGNNIAKTGWFTFSKNSAGEYTLYNIEAKKYNECIAYYNAAQQISDNSKVQALLSDGDAATKADDALFNDDTVVIVNDKNGDLSVYTGVKSVPTIKLTDASSKAFVSLLAKNTNGYATLVYIDVDGASTISGDAAANLVYVISYDGKYVTTDNETFHKYTVLEGDKKVKVESEDKIADYPGKVYAVARYVTKNADGRLTNFEKVTKTEDVVLGGAGVKSSDDAIAQSAGTLIIGGKKYLVAEDAKITLMTMGKVKDLGADATVLNKDKDADYEVAADISAKELVDTLKGYTYTYDFAGKLTENAGNVISELFVTIKTAKAITDDAVEPIVTVTADAESYVVGDKATLTASVSNADKCGTLTYQWFKWVDANENDEVEEEEIELIAGATKTTYVADTSAVGTTTYGCVAINTDSKKADEQVAYGVDAIDVVVTAKPEGKTYDLKLSGIFTNGTVAKVYENGVAKDPASSVTTMTGTVNTYKIAEGADVIIDDADIAASGTVAIAEGVRGTAASNKVTFKMTQAVELSADPAAVYVYTVDSDVEVLHIYKDGSTTEEIAYEKVGDKIYVPAFTGDIDVVVKTTEANAAVYTSNATKYTWSAADATDTKGTEKTMDITNVAGNQNLWFHPVATLTLDDVTVTGVTSGHVVTVGTKLTVAASGAAVIEGEHVGTKDETGSNYIMPATDTTLSKAFKVTLKGATAKVGTVDLTDGVYFVEDGEDITTIKAVTGEGTDVAKALTDGFFTTNGSGEIVTTVSTLAADVTLTAVTKVTLKSSIAKIFYTNASGQTPTIKDSISSDVDVYVVKGSVVEAYGDTNTSGKVIKLTNATAIDSSASGTGAYAWAKFEVGEKAITVEEASAT